MYGTGSRILLMIISNNLRVYNTRVRSDCKSKKVILKNSRFLYLVDIIDARGKRRESCKAVIFGEIEGNILFKKQEFTCQIHGLHMPKVMELLTILGCVEHNIIIINSNLYAKVI